MSSYCLHWGLWTSSAKESPCWLLHFFFEMKPRTGNIWVCLLLLVAKGCRKISVSSYKWSGYFLCTNRVDAQLRLRPFLFEIQMNNEGFLLITVRIKVPFWFLTAGMCGESGCDDAIMLSDHLPIEYMERCMVSDVEQPLNDWSMFYFTVEFLLRVWRLFKSLRGSLPHS